ncbi:hypothetical protein Purlil1_8867 [Purpureocillium lilacinum]|uniref:Uncharacterized protein n=1 Tax=Purpureocillium lilacinum TaxID=33203 RepID=A0ABR0BRQ2_PURLI|nr:hypothetical protein Purlil1_8867 [Purpureocillium lilacinum]
MHLAIFLSLAVLCLIHAASSVEARPTTPSVIKLTKIDSAYWRATFSDPPLNLQGDAFFQDFYSIVDEITNNSDVKVVVFDSSSREFFSTHVDLINPLSHELWPGNGRYWDCITRLAKAPVLTIAAIRGRAYHAGAEIAAALDVRFGSKERAVLGQLEVGFGANPGGGGIEMLSRLTGRSRALEIVLGSDVMDADTAALYGSDQHDKRNLTTVGINRAIPDANFEKFVDSFARRVAGWDHFAIATAKTLINERTGFATSEQQQESFISFLAAASQGAVPVRLKAMASAGMQKDLRFETRFSQEELRFVGNGPWRT